MIRGALLTLAWFANNLVLQLPHRLTEVIQFVMEVDKSGWMKLVETELSRQ